MKILMISHEYPPVGGGGANACMHLAAQYGKAGHDVTILTVWYEGLADEEVNGSLRIIRIHSKRQHKEHCSFGEMLDYLIKGTGVARRLVTEARSKGGAFDICQVFFAIPAGPMGYYLYKRYGLPYIIRFGGGDIPGFQDRFAFIYKLLGPGEKLIWRSAAALVANSRGLKELAESFYDKKEILVIPNGVEPEGFAGGRNQNTGDDPEDGYPEPGDSVTGCTEITASEDSSTFRLLFVSRLIERKGLQFIIPMIPHLAQKCKGALKLTIVGDGPYREVLEQIAAQSGAGKYISFEGQKDKSELADYYINADVFILPSKKEGMPNVVLEAMASGLPIIMTPCQGSHELIDGNGYAVPVDGFPKKIQLFMENEELRKQMGERSRALIEERFLWSATSSEYLKLMEKVIL